MTLTTSTVPLPTSTSCEPDSSATNRKKPRMREQDKPPLTLSNPDSAVESEDESNKTADELARHLEVVFEPDEKRPRRSSLTTIPSRPETARRKTSCFVHGFLNDDRLNGPEIDGDHKSDQQVSDKDPHGHGADGRSIQSRLLSKKELSDMAFSIRELSKRLGRFRLKLNVKNVFLLTKAHDETLIKYTREVTEWLLSADAGGPYTVFVEDTLKDKPQFDGDGLMAKCANAKSRLKYWNTELCRRSPTLFDIVLALGGDGTVLYASWLFQRVVPPVLSFALGSLGFLTKFDFGEFRSTLHTAFNEGLTVSLRLRLEATVMRANKESSHAGSKDLIEQLIGDEADDHKTHYPDGTYDILNDVVLDRGPNPTMSSIEVFGDNYHITTVQADGVCIATPTGSTAYNLATGGSLCHPDNPVILVSAICAHTLSFRPIILPDTIALRVGVPYDARSSPWVSFDGKERLEIRPGDYVTVSASRYPFPTVLPLGKGGEEWVEGLSRTLNWNSRGRQKAFS